MLIRPSVGLLSPLDNIETLRPLDITDAELDPASAIQDLTWQADKITYIPGLNYLSDLFLLWHASQQCNNNTTIAKLQHHIHLVQSSLEKLPAPLRWRGGLSRPPYSNFGTDVQIVNLYITQLHIRSNLLEQIHRLLKADYSKQQYTAQQIIRERQSIVEDLLEILFHMPRETLESNGRSLVPKARDIGSALLEEGEGLGIGTVSEKAKGDLVRLLDRMEKLDFQSEFQRQAAGGGVPSP